ncbi:MAG: D-aminoacyl-tRNA deacylase [Coprococcus sp.]
MRFLIQRVNKASVTVDNKVIGSIDRGLLVFVGVYDDDTVEEADKLIRKLIGLRIFADGDGKTNLNLADVNGQLLIVSQFTLCADCKKGNRPSFTKAAGADIANKLYEYIIDECKKNVPVVAHGEFGADMLVDISNDGPFTIIFDTKDM